MPKELLFATHNVHKSREIAQMLEGQFELLNLHDLKFEHDIPETGESLQENAYIKAKYLFDKTAISCFADDTGLEVDALNGAPGIYSARYAGKDKSDTANMEKLLTELKGEEKRSARFRTVICLIGEDGAVYYFEGVVEGEILLEKRGEQGFGYDPIFKPKGSSKSFAEMTSAEKASLSHRARAVEKLIAHLRAD